MANDQVLSNSNKVDLLNAYNEIARFSPDILNQPLLMRAALRKMMHQSGVLDSSDASQLKDIAKTHVQTQNEQLKTVKERRSLEPSWV
jgi:hypothetical protein